jgi:hypothetical protein
MDISTEKDNIVPCFSCGAMVPDIQGPVHAYMTSSPGCWKIYGDILAKEYSPDFFDQIVHRITVDTYAVQHPGKPERRAIQSVNGHLISLYATYEKKLPHKQAAEILKRVIEDSNFVDRFVWLDPPDFKDTKNVADVVVATDREEHEVLVREWGDSVWQVWKEKHSEAIEPYVKELGF